MQMQQYMHIWKGQFSGKSIWSRFEIELSLDVITPSLIDSILSIPGKNCTLDWTADSCVAVGRATCKNLFFLFFMLAIPKRHLDGNCPSSKKNCWLVLGKPGGFLRSLWWTKLASIEDVDWLQWSQSSESREDCRQDFFPRWQSFDSW